MTIAKECFRVTTHEDEELLFVQSDKVMLGTALTWQQFGEVRGHSKAFDNVDAMLDEIADGDYTGEPVIALHPGDWQRAWDRLILLRPQ